MANGCNDCKHQLRDHQHVLGNLCIHPNVVQFTDLTSVDFVTRQPAVTQHISAAACRDLKGMCGANGKWFDPK